MGCSGSLWLIYLDHSNEQRQLREWPRPSWKMSDTKPLLRSCSTDACFFLCFLSVISEIQHEMTKYRGGFPDLLFTTCELLALVHFIPNPGPLTDKSLYKEWEVFCFIAQDICFVISWLILLILFHTTLVIFLNLGVPSPHTISIV